MKPEDREDLLAALKKITDGEEDMSDRIRVELPGLSPLEGDALMVSEARNVRGGDEFTWSFRLPQGAETTRLAMVLVRVDGTPNGTPTDADSGDQQNPGSKPETDK